MTGERSMPRRLLDRIMAALTATAFAEEGESDEAREVALERGAPASRERPAPGGRSGAARAPGSVSPGARGRRGSGLGPRSPRIG